MKPIEKSITVRVNQGVHGRVAAGLAKIVQSHGVQMHILKDEVIVDCSSILDVLSMGFVFGTIVKFRVHGEFASQAISEVEELLVTREEV